MHKLTMGLLAAAALTTPAANAADGEPTTPAAAAIADGVTPPAPAPAAEIPTVMEVAVPAPVTVAAPTGAALPPMNFASSVAASPLFQRIKTNPAFAQVEENLAGSPILLRVTHVLQPTAGGQAAGLLSAIVAGSTLGLLPVVTNNNLVLSYEVSVNGKPLLRRDFERAFTRAENIWTARNDPTYGLGEDGLAWAIDTATQFAEQAAKDPALAELAREYAFYFAAGE